MLFETWMFICQRYLLVSFRTIIFSLLHLACKAGMVNFLTDVVVFSPYSIAVRVCVYAWLMCSFFFVINCFHDLSPLVMTLKKKSLIVVG